MRPSELTILLREILADGEWHDEDHIVNMTSHLVSDTAALRGAKRWSGYRKGMRSSRMRGFEGQKNPDMLELGRRARVLEMLKTVGGMVETKRQWKIGAYKGGSKSRDLSMKIEEFLMDGEWHSVVDIADHVPVRPEVAQRIYDHHVTARKGKRAKDLADRVRFGSRYYMQHLLGDMKRRQGIPIEKRGKRGAPEYRLVK